MIALPESGNRIDGDNQVPATLCKATDYADPGYSDRSHTLDHVLVPSWIITLGSHNTAGKNSMLHVNNIQPVLGHFFHSMHSHVVLSEPNLFPDPSYP